MGTRADFYVGRGESAEWLGSIAWDGYPSGIDSKIFASKTEETYRKRVAAFLADRDDRSMPADGWPWPWDDSGTTDFSYALEANKVRCSCLGSKWYDPAKNWSDASLSRFHESKEACFPNMSGLKRRPTFGRHSGVIVIGG